MKVDGRAYRTIWLDADGWGVDVIDQRWLPHEFRIATLRSVGDAATAIRDMWVRGAPLIGVTAAYGVALAVRENPSDRSLDAAWDRLNATRPTAINLRWALDAVRNRLRPMAPANRAAAAYAQAAEIADEDVAINRAIGRNGLAVIRRIAETKASGEPVNILTHCNAGWLATVDYGTATAPIYLAIEEGIPVHVYVDETRPRNQGASLTAWEFLHHGAPHTLIVDNAGGHLMQQGRVDIVIVGTDRTTARGDVCNKIGTYLKALAAKDNGVPFYVALPSPTIDWTVEDGKEIPIEERSVDEVEAVQGLGADGKVARVRIAPQGSPAANPAFDVTPARLITGLITERGIAAASREGLEALFPERVGAYSPSARVGPPALRPLAGLTIVEFEGIGPGPLAGRMLAEHGAEVAVIVRPNKATLGNPDSARWGDPLRRMKRVVELDLKRPEAVEEALKLIAGADALIEGNRPGVMERLGLGPTECARRNPKLVYGRMTGWGQDGPLAPVAGHDINYVALTGLLSLTERPGAAPIVPPTVLGDAGGALGLAFGIVSGVLSARATGQGCVVDAAILDIVAALGGIALWARAAGMLDGGRPSMFHDSPFYDAYRCADGRYVTVGALEPQFYALLLDKLGLADVDAKAQYDTRRWPALKARFRELFSTRPSEEWRALLEGADVCFAPVLSLAEAAAHPHNAARSIFRKGEDGRLEAAEAPRFRPLR